MGRGRRVVLVFTWDHDNGDGDQLPRWARYAVAGLVIIGVAGAVLWRLLG